mgnify:CR=1 FL=1
MVRRLRLLGGLLGLAATALAGLAQAEPSLPLRGTLSSIPKSPPVMTLRLGRTAGSPACGLACAEFIVAEGDITRDSAAALATLARRLPRPLPVYLASPGGSLEGGMALGHALRAAGLEAIIARREAVACEATTCTPADQLAGLTLYSPALLPARCQSACVYAFAGAAARQVAEGSSLGIHQFFVARLEDRTRQPKTSYSREDFVHLQKTVAGVAAYLSLMGVSVDLIHRAAEVDPAAIRTLTRAELVDLNLVTPRLAAPPPARVPMPHESAAAPAAWPVIERAGQPFVVLKLESQSRRYGAIANEVAIGCADGEDRYHAAFREIIPARPGAANDAVARIGPQKAGQPAKAAGTLSRTAALEAARTGVLEVEVTSTATAGYPMTLEFPGQDLPAAMERLDQACKRR